MINISITGVKGIGPKKAAIIKDETGIETVEDLLYYLPRKYVDRSSFKKIKDCFVNEIVSIAGTIKNVKLVGQKKKRLEVEIDDDTDTLTGVFFGGIRYFQKIFTSGDYVIFSGKIGFYNKKQMTHPDFDFIDDTSSINAINTGRIVPLYKSSEKLKNIGLDSRGFRRAIKNALENHLHFFEETIHKKIIDKHNFMGLQKALMELHFPSSLETAEKARRRLAFNEVFFLQYYISLSRIYTRQTTNKIQIKIDEELLNEFISSLPFDLTNDQQSSIDSIKNDLMTPYPMNRLLQGDVGSGKTVVAMAASIIAIGSNLQVAIMAPTEILAFQHYKNFKTLMPENISIEILTGSTSANDKKSIYDILEKGDIEIIIGTHALIQGNVKFKNLGLIIIDEQHRFGVDQRASLRNKGEDADLLVMTATPIPRSLSLTLYGDMDISSIKTKPANRIPIETLSFPTARLNGVYNSLERYIEMGRQVYYVLPLIEESEKIDLKSAMEAFENLKKLFKHRNIELLHGKMKQTEKDEIMKNFREGNIDILVSTTVIEVGIDVPNANVIVIEHAERFGLAQLHQLRGRVGRGEHKSFCILIYSDSISNDSRSRINILTKTDDGFLIAEEDLKMRGAGELIGYRQSGHAGSLEFLDPSIDLDLIISAREEAEQIVSEITDIEAAFDDVNNKNFDKLLSGIRTKRILSILS